jgi:putative flippase GtrA
MKIFRYAVVGGAAALIDFLLFAVFAKIRAWEMLFVKVCATGSVFFWNFGARSYFIFKPLETAAAREDGPQRQVTEKEGERHRLN